MEGIANVFAKGIEGNPFIIRFKTQDMEGIANVFAKGIEGNPFIIRFKTS